MGKMSRATAATILAIALYFTLTFGFDALRAFTSPSYGLDEVWRAQTVFAIGSLFGLGPVGLIKLAAFLATVKFVAAAVCAWHIADRFRSLAGGAANTEILEGGLILIVLLSIASAGLAMWPRNSELLREQILNLVLAGICTALCMVERSYRLTDKSDQSGDIAEDKLEIAAPNGAKWFAPWR